MAGLSNRALSTMAACVAILLLVVFIVVLWTGGWYGKAIEKSDEEIGARSDDVQSGEQRPNLLNSMVVFQKSVDQFSSSSLPVIEMQPTLYERVTTTTNEVPVEENVERRKDNESIPNVLPSTKGDVEYIMPMKISQNQYEDPPDPLTSAKRHHSGHFRHSTAKVWDPHPQYEFTAFGRFFRLRLAHDSSFISPDIRVTHISANTSRRVHPGHQLDCFYSGFVDGDPGSIVNVNLCHGMSVSIGGTSSKLDTCHGNVRTSFRIILASRELAEFATESQQRGSCRPPVSFNQNFLLLKFPSKSTSQPPSDLDT
ncbi:hypothetical protein KPH14_006222 [Odynerus spinipes]|uniref:Peptidase M12B propeptide domain-containing protein n=1 Tax=Odynerus spinipes TaxID=1348599 RepID=A0AAD9RIN7_9HYME|nr:hypothetical protein KPH14_006222 [Odynerus spinipes]